MGDEPGVVNVTNCDSDAGIVPMKTDFKQNILICLRSLQSNSKNKLLWDTKVR